MTELLRGKVALNPNDNLQGYRGPKRSNPNADMHHNQSYDIFRANRNSQNSLNQYGMQYDNNDFSYNDQYDPLSRSPSKGKLWQFKPNYIDPAKINFNPEQDKPAGSQPSYEFVKSPDSREYQQYSSNIRKSGLSQVGLSAVNSQNDIRRMRTFDSRNANSTMQANSSNIGLESEKYNVHFKKIANGQGIAGARH